VWLQGGIPGRVLARSWRGGPDKQGLGMWRGGVACGAGARCDGHAGVARVWVRRMGVSVVLAVGVSGVWGVLGGGWWGAEGAGGGVGVLPPPPLGPPY